MVPPVVPRFHVEVEHNKILTWNRWHRCGTTKRDKWNQYDYVYDLNIIIYYIF